MKYIDEYRDPELTRRLIDKIHAITTRHWRLMEVCGGQTHAILKSGLDELLPAKIELIHGPGCP
ncbi:MAG: hydrogenase formation protein HypD, partial [Chloroflexi bacterium]|nr:hydrogenase formation protein HypD [Chloroflexota bacterium]